MAKVTEYVHKAYYTFAMGQGSLACCDSWGRKESDRTERLNWTERKGQYQEKFPGLKLRMETGTQCFIKCYVQHVLFIHILSMFTCHIRNQCQCQRKKNNLFAKRALDNIFLWSLYHLTLSSLTIQILLSHNNCTSNI